jgi:hypothetical protein
MDGFRAAAFIASGRFPPCVPIPAPTVARSFRAEMAGGAPASRTIASRFGMRNSCPLELEERDLNVTATRVAEVPRIPLARVAPAPDIV